MLPALPLLLLLATAARLSPPDVQESLDKTSEKVLRELPPDPLAPDKAVDEWTGSFSLGASHSTGAARPHTLSASGEAIRRGDRHRGRLEAFWLYAGEEGAAGGHRTTQRRLGGSGQLDYFFAAEDYFLVAAAGETNRKTDLDLRLTSGVGYGRQFAEGERWTVSAELGGGWFYEDFGGEEPHHLGRARLGYHWRWDTNSPLLFEQRGELFPSLENRKDVYYRQVVQVRYEFSPTLFGQTEWRYEWDSQPSAGRSSTDQYLMVTVGLEF